MGERQDKSGGQSGHFVKPVTHDYIDRNQNIVLCIELSQTLCSPAGSLKGNAPILEVVRALLHMVEELIIVQPNSAVGCLTFRNGRRAEDGIVEAFPLRPLDANYVRNISDCVADLEETGMVGQHFPFTATVPASLDVMLAASDRYFTEDTQNADNRIFLVTDVDTPVEFTDPIRLEKVQARLLSLYRRRIDITTFFLHTEHAAFNDSSYAEILKTREWGIPGAPQSTSPLSICKLREKMLSQKDLNRAYFSCPLVINKTADLVVSVAGYVATTHERPGTRYKYIVKHDGRTKSVHQCRKYKTVDNEKYIRDADRSSVYWIGGAGIEVTDAELRKMTRGCSKYESFLEILGFRAINTAAPYYSNIGRAYYILPRELPFSGSAKVLASLNRSMFEKGKAAIVWGQLKAGFHPTLFALIPSDGETCALRLVRIPFIEEVRCFPTLDGEDRLFHTREYELVKTVSQNLIRHFSLRTSYRPSDIRNPLLRNFYSTLYHEQSQDAKRKMPELQYLPESDSTLHKVQLVRDRIENSIIHDEPPIISEYINCWNIYYNHIIDKAVYEYGAPKRPLKYFTGDTLHLEDALTPNQQRTQRNTAKNAKTRFNL
ncbi:ABL117Cp [Eremothecium gossypii ATCC 10895]|uniref:DNA helicase n=1 Tax=Eremothecium gossypii (strain ATCC 10895 / CBS 109.51 / FGSC 9923 / NRRL Y-1056) TaxID=284811 RepID=Q75DZ0_EREGS|nr:ABL117Cp [Eremothecium gossypii ATCC 10895]AAS50654.1 ABL117Cp [Eremothecium gossypii ATCC 10895]AEY94942.1 FABL117Cp [Eremothecium gossypii FDAG1]